jgi:hypothetical protein
LQARSVAAEFLKAALADGDRSPCAIKLELHKIAFREVKSPARKYQAGRCRLVRAAQKVSI